MAHYIDADKLRAEIEQRIAFCKRLADKAADIGLQNTMEANDLIVGECSSLLSFLATLQESSLPSNLDEAAEEFAEGEWDGLHDNDGNPLYTADYVEYAFKTGAEWMAGQGIEIEGKCADEEFIDTEHGILSFEKRPFTDGDDVIIQIRKK